VYTKFCEKTKQLSEKALNFFWIPAFAGMTSLSWRQDRLRYVVIPALALAGVNCSQNPFMSFLQNDKNNEYHFELKEALYLKVQLCIIS